MPTSPEQRTAATDPATALQRWQLHFERTPLAVIEWDLGFRVSEWNPAAQRIFGYTREEALGRHAAGLIVPESAREHVDRIWSELCAKQGGLRSTNENNRKDGSIILCEWYNTPLVDAQGRVLGVASLVQDVTDKHALEQQVRRVQHLDALGQLAGGVAHDFNNMLTGIRGYAQLMVLALDEPLDPARLAELREHATSIVQAAATAADLTSKLLAFSRSGRSAFTPVDVHRVLENAIGLLRRSVDRRIMLSTRLAATQTLVLGDAAQLQNAILNLGINARDAMPSGGELTITTSDVVLDAASCSASPFDLRPGPHVRIEVVDTGVGMSPAVMDRMFEPFFSTKEAGKGTGLGLSALYGTISEHGGSIAVTSAEGVGTRFVLDLPIARDAPRSIAASQAAAPLEPRKGCVLIVDDEPVVRKVAQTMAKRLGYEVLVAADGREGLEVYLEHRSRIDVVVLDIVMPRMNGPDCFRAIRAEDPGAKVILCSGFARDAEIPVLLEEGLCGYVTKPFSFETFGEAIRRVMGGGELRREG